MKNNKKKQVKVSTTAKV